MAFALFCSIFNYKQSDMQIESPCHENYSKMDKRADGRYCTACEKVVIDFTKLSNTEITEVIRKQSSDSICIRAKSFQFEQTNLFNKVIYNLRERIFTIRLNPLRLAFMGLISGIAVFSSSCIGKKTSSIPAYDTNTKDSVTTNQNTAPKK